MSPKLIKICYAAMLIPGLLFADAIRTGFNSSTFPGNDDESIYVNTGIDFNFYGISGPNVFLNNNGNITFSTALWTYTPSAITAGSTPMIAPFFADVDTRGSVADVTYGLGTVDGRDAFGINYIDVDHFVYGNGPLNSFQLVLIDRSDIGAGDFDFEFNYDQILWEAGTASGSGQDGLGGTSAHVGFTNGNGTYWELPGSGVNGSLLDGSQTALVNTRINSNVDGRMVFSVRNGVVDPIPDPISNVPEPGIISMIGLGLVSVLVARKRK